MKPDPETMARMAAAAFEAFFGMRPLRTQRDQQRLRDMEHVITAALALLPDLYREGWIAGRDAALLKALEQATKMEAGVGFSGASVVAAEIRHMQPPEDEK